MNNKLIYVLFRIKIGVFLIAVLFMSSQKAMTQTWTPKSDFINGGSLNAYTFTINDTIYVGNTGARGIYQYNVTTDTWTTKANVPVALFNRTASSAFVLNGKGYLVGGINSMGVCMNDVWQYDALADIWVQKTNFPGGKRAGARNFVIGNNAYFGGGYDTIGVAGFSSVTKNDFWQYDPISDTWTTKANLPYDSSYLLYPFAFSIKDKGYLSCGQRYKYASGMYKDTDVNRTYQYDTSTNTWTQKASFPGNVRSGGVAFVIDSIAYCGTGINDTSTVFANFCYNDFYSYNPSLNSWTSLPTTPFVSRTYAIAASLTTRRAFVGTGWGAPSTTAYYQDWWEFKPAVNNVIEIENNAISVKYYPNPCYNELNIEIKCNKQTDYSYCIYNLIGQKISEGTLLFNTIINTTALSSGNYLLEIHNKDIDKWQLFSVMK